jgi:hypothetical protein
MLIRIGICIYEQEFVLAGRASSEAERPAFADEYDELEDIDETIYMQRFPQPFEGYRWYSSAKRVLRKGPGEWQKEHADWQSPQALDALENLQSR